MNGPMPDLIRKLIELISTSVEDRETLDELANIIVNHSRWKDMHELFSRIRSKTLKATESKLFTQYRFEEICAKSIYNISTGVRAPFDADSPFWVIPRAFEVARHFGIDQDKILQIILANEIVP